MSPCRTRRTRRKVKLLRSEMPPSCTERRRARPAGAVSSPDRNSLTRSWVYPRSGWAFEPRLGPAGLGDPIRQRLRRRGNEGVPPGRRLIEDQRFHDRLGRVRRRRRRHRGLDRPPRGGPGARIAAPKTRGRDGGPGAVPRNGRLSLNQGLEFVDLPLKLRDGLGGGRPAWQQQRAQAERGCERAVSHHGALLIVLARSNGIHGKSSLTTGADMLWTACLRSRLEFSKQAASTIDEPYRSSISDKSCCRSAGGAIELE